MTDVVLHSGPTCRLPHPNEGWRRSISHRRPLRVAVGDRLYIVHDGALWGYGQVCMLTPLKRGRTLLGMGAPNSVSLKCSIKRFQGFRYRWWDTEAEVQPQLSRAIAEAAETGRTVHLPFERRVLCQDESGEDVVIFTTTMVTPLAGPGECS